VSVQLTGVSKHFGGAYALDGVDLFLEDGSVHGLLGQNGSGKSTVIKVLSGLHVPDAGAMQADGRPVPLPMPAGAAHALGFSFVHQDLALVPALTVAENLLMPEIAQRGGLRRWSDRQLRREAGTRLQKLGLDVDPAVPIGDLPAVDRSMVAIARAVTAGGDASPRLLVLDEPTVFLPRAEVSRLFELVHAIAAGGGAVLFVSHDLDEVKELTDHYTVLRNGRVVGSGATADVGRDELVEHITGHQVLAAAPQIPAQAVAARETRLSLRGLVTPSGPVDLDLGAGEVLGVSGLAGSGFEEVPYAMFGARSTSGRLTMDGVEHDLTRWGVTQAILAGLAFVPGNRAVDGLATTMTAQENLMVPVLRRYWRAWFDRRRAGRDAVTIFDDLEVRPREVGLPISSFSGGNAQKVLMGKWLQLSPRVLLVHEPTQGVDVGARAQIINTLRRQAAAGAGVAVFSTDAEQLAELCDRVLVLHRNGVVELQGEDLSKTAILAASVGESAEEVGVR
jgi:ribose transport system ATP-binding protein